MNKARKFDWHRSDNSFEAWLETYQTFENVGTLPPRAALAK